MKSASGFRSSSTVLIALGLVLGLASNPGHAQVPRKGSDPARGRATSLSGWLTIVWGDSRDGRSAMVYTLTDVSGRRTVLRLDEAVAQGLGGVLRFNGKYVRVQGTLTPTFRPAAAPNAAQSQPAVLDVTSISPLPDPREPTVGRTPELPSLAVVSGSRPWVTIMCKFSDIAAEPNDRNYFEGMYGDARPGLNHYWREVSFDTANVGGSATGTGWYTLPHTELYYNPTDTGQGTDLGKLAADCIAAANDDVDYSLYSGINMMFNSDFDNGWAWGGGTGTMTLDGVTKSWSCTWEPPWGYHDISVIAHEMGHGFGLPHSTYDDAGAAVYDNDWDVMSADRYNCGAATDGTYGCMAQHTIAYHKDLMGWIPAAQKTTVASGSWATVTLEDLAVPASANFQVAIVPIGGSATNFYTVEARRFTGYDVKLPGEAVIVHNVDTTRGIPAFQVPGGKTSDDPDVRFTAGESFRDAANKITVTVDSDGATGSVVTILNGVERPTSEAGGPYTRECAGAATTVPLDGSASSDPERSTLTYSWSTTCDGTFDDPTIEKPTLTVNGATGCSVSCTVSLKVTDAQSLSHEDSANITITDTNPPALSGVPGSQTVQCDAVPPAATVTATDVCDGSVATGLSEKRVDGNCAASYTLTRSWTAADECGNTGSASQTITVEDTVAPVIACNNPPTMTPPDAPIAFTATGTDNCSTPSVRISGYDCVGKRNSSRLSSCVVAIVGGRITIRDSGGVNDTISWTVESVDGCGNTTTKRCSIQVVNPGHNK